MFDTGTQEVLDFIQKLSIYFVAVVNILISAFFIAKSKYVKFKKELYKQKREAKKKLKDLEILKKKQFQTWLEKQKLDDNKENL